MFGLASALRGVVWVLWQPALDPMHTVIWPLNMCSMHMSKIVHTLQHFTIQAAKGTIGMILQ
jgi:hypothetical protein